MLAELEALVSRYEGQDIDIFEESLQKKSNTPYLREAADREKEKPKAKSVEKPVAKSK